MHFPTSKKRQTLSIRLYHLPPLTPLPSAVSICSVHIDVSTQSVDRASSFRIVFSDTGKDIIWIIHLYRVHISTFLPRFPKSGFTHHSFYLNNSFRHQYYQGSDCLHLSPQIQALSSPDNQPSCRSIPNHPKSPCHRFYHRVNVTGVFQISP